MTRPSLWADNFTLGSDLEISSIWLKLSAGVVGKSEKNAIFFSWLRVVNLKGKNLKRKNLLDQCAALPQHQNRGSRASL
jgi:hypothetical protein